ncbi:hypothetical protein [Pseudomonas chlororaphis]|uniref:hypothetical protein n=1 Tax=Pseudomonas chlororaphis TaxID=587753 RepID=UPI000F565308|nr:hypothetical protein [Pseudomonas chlororaphis]
MKFTTQGCAASQKSNVPAPIIKTVDKDLALKLVASFAIFLQTALTVYGYLELSAFYEQFGIYTSELELGTPTILLAGYSYSFSSIMNSVDDVPYVGPAVPGFISFTIALAFVTLLLSGVRKMADNVMMAVVGAALLLMLFVAPVWGIVHGLERGKVGLKSNTGLDWSKGVSKEYSIVTKENKRLTGHLVVADTKNTFLLVGTTVYKIDNKTKLVIRENALTPKTETSN